MIRGPESIYLTTTEMEQSEGRVPSNRRKVSEGLFIFLKTLHQVYILPSNIKNIPTTCRKEF